MERRDAFSQRSDRQDRETSTEPEVRDADTAVAVEKDVPGLEISVNDAILVSCRDDRDDLAENRHGAVGAQARLTCEVRGEITAFGEVLDDVRNGTVEVHPEHLKDARMIEPVAKDTLTTQKVDDLGLERQLDRSVLVGQRGVSGTPDRAESTEPDPCLEHVFPDAVADLGLRPRSRHRLVRECIARSIIPSVGSATVHSSEYIRFESHRHRSSFAASESILRC